MKGGERRYGKVVGVTGETANGRIHQSAILNLVMLQATITTKMPEVSRIFYAIKDLPEKKPYVLGVRAVQTKDFLTAQVSDIPWTMLDAIAEETIKNAPTYQRCTMM